MPSKLFSLSFVLCLVLSATVTAQRPSEFRLMLEHPKRLSLKGESFALFPCWPHKGIKNIEILEVQELDLLKWFVPAEGCDGSRMSWFLVQNMKEEAEIEKFLANPEEWSWVQVSFTLDKKGISGRQGVLCTRGAKLLGAGRIVGPDGKPPLRLYLHAVAKKGQKMGASYDAESSRVGYDPKSGRFWAQCPKEIGDIACVLNIQASADPAQGLADRFGVPLTPGQRMRIRLPHEAVLVGNMKGPGTHHDLAIHAKLKPSSGQGITRESRIQSQFRFKGLLAGSYDLKLTLRSDGPTLFEKKGLILEEGKTLTIPEAFDVLALLRPVKISVVDPVGSPLSASVMQITLSQGGYTGSGSVTDAGGIAERLVLNDGPGGYYRIHAKGYAPTIIYGVKSNTEVQLYPSHDLHVQLVGLPKDLFGSNKLRLRAEPVAGYPPHAWNLLRIKNTSVPQRGKRHRDPPSVQYCSARVLGDKPLLLKLSHPGKWKLSLSTGRFGRTKLFALPGIVEMTKASQKTAVRIPAETVQKIKEHLQEQEDRRGGIRRR